MSEPLWQPRTDRSARLLGGGFLIGGAALIGYQTRVILDAVTAREDRVTFFLAAFGLGAMAVTFGLYWLIRGLAGYTAIRALQTDPRRMRRFSIAMVVAIGGLMVGLKFWLSSLGYE